MDLSSPPGANGWSSNPSMQYTAREFRGLYVGYLHRIVSFAAAEPHYRALSATVANEIGYKKYAQSYQQRCQDLLIGTVSKTDALRLWVYSMRGLATLVIREWSLCLTVLYCGRLAKIVLEAFFILSYFGVCIIVVFFEFLLTMVLNLTQLNVSGVVDELIDIYWFMWEHHMRKPLSVLMEVLETKRMKIILPITTAYLWWKVGRGAKKYYFGDPQTQIARACASMAFTSSFLVVARLKCLQLPIYSKLRLPGEAHLSDDQARKLDKRFAAAPNFPLVPLITIPLVLYFGAITALMIGFGMRRRPTVSIHR